MEYIWGALAGALYGGIVGLLKYLILWRGIFHPKDESKVTTKAVYTRMMISYVINVVTLVAVYFVRNIIPFDFVAFAVATAVGLSVSGKAFSIRKVVETKQITE